MSKLFADRQQTVSLCIGNWKQSLDCGFHPLGRGVLGDLESQSTLALSQFPLGAVLSIAPSEHWHQSQGLEILQR